MVEWWHFLSPITMAYGANKDIEAAKQEGIDHPFQSFFKSVAGLALIIIITILVLYLIYRLLTNPRVATAAGTVIKAVAV